jgi:hypothetical protein
MAAAPFNIAGLYETGLGIAKRDVDAARWYHARPDAA